MLKKLIIFLSFLLCACSNQKIDNKEIIINDEPEIQIEEKIEEEIEINEEVVENESNNKPITDNKQSNSKTSGNSSNTTSNTNKDDKKSNSNSNTHVVEEKKEIWDQLGMTKDQYYNKPMYSWEHVDFEVEKYGDETSTKKECLTYGDSYQPYLNGEVSYNCSTVTSASGKYLGEMFYTEKLN